MDIFIRIVIDVILPLFLLIGAGAYLHRLFHFDMNTLSKITTYFLLPAVGFVNIYESDITSDVLLNILFFLVLQNGTLIMLSAMMARWLKLDRSLGATFQNTMVLNNSGNFGIPVSQLIFRQEPLGLSIQIVVTIFQNFLTNTYGLFQFISASEKKGKMTREFLKNPIIYALIFGVVFRVFHISVPSFLWQPLEHVADAFLAIALLTLGAQLAYMNMKRIPRLMFITIGSRLILSPFIAFLIILILHIKGITAQALLIASAYPCSRNTALYALEYNHHPEYAAQAVFLSTLLSPVTVASVIGIAHVYF
ncbi:transporter [Anoxybacillus gonensis]|uniref:AEC family transporter n=1 Tax=Anoxybacillus gonensis TaxID=198467 RepID=A0AAW7TL05_9BACL|nr:MULTISPECIES: AEC family transporter [Anoxybacillus]AKS38566.1 transporter [Anoxybacillus gonensis]EMI11224.1 auxin efflux carrier [Anoxybacillus gonensis]KGP59585.1 transporter [Anoxybacillus gonensis]MCX8045704.1 AEC family transporter [Anoxybacillus gonensis]MDO0878358.1 AEC family transporter [Anoxybacillus gonensis]